MCVISVILVYQSNSKIKPSNNSTLSTIKVITFADFLPEVTITCSKSPYDAIGQCYYNIAYPCTPECVFSGYQYHFCTYYKFC